MLKKFFVVGIEDKETDVVNLQIQRDSIKIKGTRLSL